MRGPEVGDPCGEGDCPNFRPTKMGLSPSDVHIDPGEEAIDVARVVRETFLADAIHLPSVDSTNTRAAALAAEGRPKLPLLVLADEQTAGRGRGANRWWSGPGALTFSLLLDAETVGADSSRSPLVALATAVAVVGAVEPLLPDHPPGIHWPNDVMAGGRKLAGILVEVLPDRKHVVGIGLHVNNATARAPAELQSTACALCDLTGRRHDRTALLIALLQGLERALDALRADRKVLAARADALCLQHGRTLTLRWGDRTAVGRCRGIAPDGALRLETGSGVECFYSGILVPG